MSSDEKDKEELATNIHKENLRVIETKQVFPEDYLCQRCVKKEKKCTKLPKLDETISRSIPTNKLNESLKNQKCSHCGKSTGECLCLTDEVRKELTKLHECKNEERKQNGGENVKTKK